MHTKTTALGRMGTMTLVLAAFSLLLTTVFAPVAQVDAQAEATPFADQMPAETVFYASLRTDQAYIDALNSVLGRFGPVLDNLNQSGAGVPPSQMLDLNALLDLAFQQSAGVTFSQGVRPWLGDNAAIGVFGENSSQFLLAAQVTDGAAALDFFRNTAGSEVTESTQGDFTVLSDATGATIATNGGELYAAMNQNAIPFNGALQNNLASQSNFQNAVSSLPAGQYNAVFYSDLGSVAQDLSGAFMQGFSQGFGGSMGNNGQGNVNPAQQVPDSLPFAVGATILNNSTLTLDVASPLMDDATSQAVGNALSTPISTDFARFIPSEAGLVIHASNLQATYNQVVQAAQQQSGADVQSQLEQVRQLSQQFLGVPFEDLLGLLSGDYALFAGAPEGAVMNTMQGNAPQFSAGLVLETTDAATAEQVLSSVQTFASSMAGNQQNVTVESGQVAGAQALIINATVNQGGMSFPLELVFAVNQDVVVFANRSAAETVLQGQGGLNNSQNYQTASADFLPNATSVWYVGQNGLRSLGEAIAAGANVTGQSQAVPGQPMELVNQIVPAFNNLTISTASAENGNAVLTRLTIALSDMQ